MTRLTSGTVLPYGSRNRNPPSVSRGLHMSKASSDRKGLVLLLLAAAQFVVVLDASIVNVALPSIGRDLQFSQDDLSWVALLFTVLAFNLVGDGLQDALNPRSKQ